MDKLHLISLGCTKNLIDSEIMLGQLLDEFELTNDIKEADVVIINTCGFIQSAKEESLEAIFEAIENKKEDALLVVAGCLTQRYKEELQKEIPEIDIFTGVGDYDKIKQMIKEKKSIFSDRVFLSTSNYYRVVSNSKTHAYIKLSEGCNQQCSFCAIPKFKGKLQSRKIDDIIEELKILLDKGFFDFTFVSQDSSSYLRDFGIDNGLIKLIDEVEKLPIKSARILYLYPSTTTKELIYKIANSKVFHTYYDMPLQHISNNMLKIMKRGKNKEAIIELLKEMKKTNGFLRTGFIVGHPGESEEDFNELVKFIKEFEFDRISVFEYSDEEDTISYNLKNKLDKKVIEERATILGDIAKELELKSLKKDIGKEIDIVLDGYSNEEFLLSAKKLLWAEEIDGEILINDKEIEEELEFYKVYKAKVTDIVDNRLLATITKLTKE